MYFPKKLKTFISTDFNANKLLAIVIIQLTLLMLIIFLKLLILKIIFRKLSAYGAIHKRRRNILGDEGGLKLRCCMILEGRS